MKNSILTFAFLLVAFCSMAQGTITGTVLEQGSNFPLMTANVVIEGTQMGNYVDFDGKFIIENVPAGTYTVVCSFISYETIRKTEVVVKDGETTTLDMQMKVASIALKGAVVKAKQIKNNEAAMTNMAKKDAGLIATMSSESIKKTNSSNIADAVKRVSGVSTVGNYIFVRGLSDRYLKTTLNGAEIPSIDPRRNSIQMDIFPTNLIDNLVVSKTFTANQPGDWAGGLVNVNTKDFPEAFTLSFSSSLGYNTNTTFNDNFLSADRSATDWLGFDNGMRDNPIGDNEVVAPITGSYFDAMTAAGLQNDLAAVGVESVNDIGTASGQQSINEVISALNNNNPELDLSFDDVKDMLTTYRTDANQDLSAQGRAFNNSWEPIKRRGALNQSYSVTFGNSKKLSEKENPWTLGYNVGLTYKRKNNAISEGVYGRYKLTGPSNENTSLNTEKLSSVQMGTESALISGLANVSVEKGNNTIGFTYMPNRIGENQARFTDGVNNSDDANKLQQSRDIRYQERSIDIFQLKGKHKIEKWGGAKINWIGSYTAGKMNTPDFRSMNNNYYINDVVSNSFTDQNGNTLDADAVQADIDYLIEEGLVSGPNDPNLLAQLQNEASGYDGISALNYNTSTSVDTTYTIEDNLYPSPTRYFREMTENTIDFKGNFERGFQSTSLGAGKFMAGYSFVNRTRDLQENRYSFVNTGVPVTASPADLFVPENMQVVTNQGEAYINLRNDTELQNSYDAKQTVQAFYAMTDFTPTEKTRVVVGVRAEKTDMLLESRKLQDPSLGDTEREEFRGALDNFDVLPSLNLTYTFFDDKIKTTKMRAGYARTLARPSFREKAPFATYDFETQQVITGNPELESATIDNADVRFEHYPAPGQLMSVSVFYKNFNNPIEKVTNPKAGNEEITFKNVENAMVFGTEIEFQRDLDFISSKLSNWSATLNLTLVHSATRIDALELESIRATDLEHKSTRPMFGQSPYIFNGILSYKNAETGWSSNVSMNWSGKKLILVTKGGTPDVFQKPVPELDFNISKTFAEKWTIGAQASNLLNPKTESVYEYNNTDYVWNSFKRGMTFSLGLSYRI